MPIAQLVTAPYTHAAWLLVAAGIGIAAVAVGAFKRAGTGIVPFDPATALVTGGLYRYTRNPMYPGMVLLLVGVAIALGSLGAWLPIPVFVCGSSRPGSSSARSGFSSRLLESRTSLTSAVCGGGCRRPSMRARWITEHRRSWTHVSKHQDAVQL
jgi:Phospholipid methyltransferase